ncbi:hypothetical protein HY605_02060 [Candidatus Peregrinibacteria bacterium]|nr:hypothetical protein [Candidatus Peregrinibacteria bacterium]
MFTPQLLLYGMAFLCLMFCLPALVNPKRYRKTLIDMAKDEKIVRLYGSIILLMGFFFLSVQWRFENVRDWMVIIPVIGWLSIVKGVVYTWFPEFVERKVKIFFGDDSKVTLWAVVGIILAVLLTYVTMNYISLGEIVAG